MKCNKPVSLCAKWLPSEGKALDTKFNFVKQFTAFCKISYKYYRTNIIVSLRKYIDILETKICTMNYGSIDYSKVASCAMHKLSKAFLKHDKDNYTKWLDGLKTNETKVNASQLFPYEVIKPYCNNSTTNQDALYEAQWKGLVINAIAQNAFENSIAVCDTSGSMKTMVGKNVSALQIAISISLLISECTNEPFKHKIITFSDCPRFVTLGSDRNPLSLKDKVHLVTNSAWGMNTNLQKTFDLILEAYNASNTSNKDMIKNLFIISDMQFDVAVSNQTNFETIKNKFNALGYPMPNIIFWNVNSKNDAPVTIHESGTVLISGFSPSIIKYLYMNDVTPYKIVQNVLNGDRYAIIKKKLEE